MPQPHKYEKLRLATQVPSLAGVVALAAVCGVFGAQRVAQAVVSTGPRLTLPGNLKAEATSSLGAIVRYTASATDPVDGILTPVCTPPSGNTFPLGTATVSCSTTDQAGATATGSFTVNVVDTTPPKITLGSPTAVFNPGTSTGSLVLVVYDVSATDLVDSQAAISCKPATGSSVSVGSTFTASCSASDTHHNTASKSFSVTVPAHGQCYGMANGTACNDGNACTQTDTCKAGVCTGSNPVVCTASDQCHTAGTCNSATGTCSNPNKLDGSTCTGTNACFQTNTCKTGVCTGSNPVVCTASDQCHTAGTCNSTTGVCSNPNQPNGTGCQIGNLCTQNDTCAAGTCQQGTPIPLNNTNPCLIAACDPAKGVVTTPVAQGTPCTSTGACGGTNQCDGQGMCACTIVLPPDPATVAPALDLTVATNIVDSTAFLYTGTNPIQTGVAAGTIQPQRVSVLRGLVITRDGAALPGAKITVFGHPELGQTLSRADGKYDLVVNGGGAITVEITKDSYIPVRKTAQTTWQRFATVTDAALIPYDSQVTTVDLTSATPIQVARGSVVSDTDGMRQQTFFFAAGTQASMSVNNSTQPLTSLHVRATEFTVGSNGPKAMPADLPPTSAYTYAFEASVDEAVAAGATSVQFTQPVIAYNENFLNAPVGGIVPLGYYDRQNAIWVAMPNGRVIQILSITGGVANLDIDGSGTSAGTTALQSLGITVSEQQQLATFYTAGKSLWRISLPHFTLVDANWGGLPPCNSHCKPDPKCIGTKCNKPKPRDCQSPNHSVIGCETQDLGEGLPASGTPLSLHYNSKRMSGRTEDYIVTLPINGPILPDPPPKRIDVVISVAGRDFPMSLATAPNLTTTFTWDGKDAYGRVLQGKQIANVDVGYVYDLLYATPSQYSGSN